ncbi:MAG: patatin [Desulfuromonadales bacterium]|nr:patatin [Desulfuromonadales bacterium]
MPIDRINTWFGRKKPSVGLALGSGSARGLAHIGVIRALEEADIPIDYIAGTSIGALVGAVYAAGNLDSLAQAYSEFTWKKIAYFFDLTFPKSGLIDGKKITDFVRGYVNTKNIEDLRLPFLAVATNIENGAEVRLTHGDVIDAVRASFSVPGIFTPTHHQGLLLVDGGLVNPVPVSALRKMGAKRTIAVDLNHDIINGKAPDLRASHLEPKAADKTPPTKLEEAMDWLNFKLQSLDNPALKYVRNWWSEEPTPNIFELMLASINIMETRITRSCLQLDPPDLLIQPPLGHIRFLEFNRADEIIQLGYDEARKQLQKAKLFSDKRK